MINKNKVLALITARSGNKGLKGENIIDLDGNPSIASPVSTALKSGLIHILKYFAKYYEGKNLGFIIISQGCIFDDHKEDFYKNHSSFCLNKGLLDPKDIYGKISFLLSNESQLINYKNIIVDDGFTL